VDGASGVDVAVAGAGTVSGAGSGGTSGMKSSGGAMAESLVSESWKFTWF
jgi:hypothetical protein